MRIITARQDLVRRLAATVLLLSAVLPSTALAQAGQDAVRVNRPGWVHSDRRVSKLPRKSAKQVLGTQGIATSLDALRSVLQPGDQVVFAQRGTSPLASVFTTGGLWSGREVLVAEIAGDRLILVRKGLFHTEELVLPADAIRRIDIVDSTRNGYLLGAVVGGVLGLAEVRATSRYARTSGECNLCPIGYAFGLLLPFVGGGVGALIDSTINETVYEGASSRKRVVVGPLLDREHVGLLAQVRF